jgi:hypothetical protein
MMRALWSMLLRWIFEPSFNPQMSDEWQKNHLYTSGKS